MALPPNLNMRPAWRAAIEQQIKASTGGSRAYELDVFKQFLVSDLRPSCHSTLHSPSIRSSTQSPIYLHISTKERYTFT